MLGDVSKAGFKANLSQGNLEVTGAFFFGLVAAAIMGVFL